VGTFLNLEVFGEGIQKLIENFGFPEKVHFKTTESQ
jgi:hypothetical protein